MFIIGEKEKSERSVQIREFGKKDQETLALSEIPNKLREINHIKI